MYYPRYIVEAQMVTVDTPYIPCSDGLGKAEQIYMQPHQYTNSCWSDQSAAIVGSEQMYLTQKIYDEFVKHGWVFVGNGRSFNIQ